MPVDYSVVIPVFNEEQTIPELSKRLDAVIALSGGEWEVIFVNDGSTDRTFDLLVELRSRLPYVKIVDLSRNFGHQPALTAGLEYSSGAAVMMMDGDLQDTPEALPELIRKWREGFQVVYAIRTKRKEGWLKRLAFFAFYRIQKMVAHSDAPVDAGVFSLLDRKVVNVLCAMPERNRYLAGLRAYAGFRQTGIEVERGARRHGKPKVTVYGLFKLALDAIFAFSTLPLRLVFVYGVVLSIVSLIIGLVGLFYRFVLHTAMFSWAYGLTTVFFFGGIQLISVGIIGEYIGRIYEEVKQRPYYVARSTIGFEREDGARSADN